VDRRKVARLLTKATNTAKKIYHDYLMNVIAKTTNTNTMNHLTLKGNTKTI